METRKLQLETNAKDKELKQFNSLNANLGFLVEDLRFKQENMQAAIRAANSQIRKNESYIRSFKNAVYWVAQNIDDYEKLKMSVLHELKRYVEDHDQKIVVEDSDIQNENKVQMQFLKKSVEALHNKLTREQAEHVRNREQVMEINQKLIEDINGDGGLKETIDKLVVDFNKLGGSKKYNEIMKKTAEHDRMMQQIEQSEKLGTMPSGRSISQRGDESQMQDMDPEIAREMQSKRQYIEKLRNELKRVKEENDMLQ